MKNLDLFATLLVVVGTVLLVFFLFNNVMHIGIHVGHSHSSDGDRSSEMVDMEDTHADDVEEYEISPGEVAKKIRSDKDIILLDVRTLGEYEQIHLENALLLPVGELSINTLANIGLGENSKDKEIIIYCRSGVRSKQAYDTMAVLGYTNIKSVAGGLVHWQEDNYPFTEIGAYDVGVLSTAPVDDDSDMSRISFDRADHDFGDVPQSQGILETTFEVRNDGQRILEIGELSTSCGCTEAKISSKSVQPNSTATLIVYFDPNFHTEPAGKLTRTVFIPSNDPTQPEAEVRIMVDILEGE